MKMKATVLYIMFCFRLILSELKFVLLKPFSKNTPCPQFKAKRASSVFRRYLVASLAAVWSIFCLDSAHAQQPGGSAAPADTWLQILEVAMVPLTVAIAGLLVNWLLKGRETNLKLVEIAINILTSPKQSAAEEPLRKWATDIIDRLSPVKLRGAREPLIKGYLSLPSSPGSRIPTGYAGSTDAADLGVWTLSHLSRVSEKSDFDKVSDILARLKFDVVGLCEVHGPDAANKLKLALERKGQRWSYTLANTQTKSGHRPAIFWREDVALAIPLESIAFEFKGELTRIEQGQPLFKRHPLFTYCRVHENGQHIDFIFVLVHLTQSFNRGGSQPAIEQARHVAIASLVKMIQWVKTHYSGIPIILAGTFHEELESAPLISLQESLDLRVLTTAEKVGISTFRPDISAPTVDHIFVSEPLKIRHSERSAVIELDNYGFFAPSDRRPLVVRLAYPSREAT
jgi:endonuclease/exonuclease/phosphatase family metal-dependent hydrolase